MTSLHLGGYERNGRFLLRTSIGECSGSGSCALRPAGNSWFQTSLTEGEDVPSDLMGCDLTGARGLSVL